MTPQVQTIERWKARLLLIGALLLLVGCGPGSSSTSGEEGCVPEAELLGALEVAVWYLDPGRGAGKELSEPNRDLLWMQDVLERADAHGTCR